MKDKIIVWPDKEYRNQMKQRMKIEYGFQKYIGIIDGTLIFLNKRPTKYGDSYYCRKGSYALMFK